jgi:hypothetical protein
LKRKDKPKAFLFGPFLGELSWEFYRFAPHAIYLKKYDPEVKIIVLTREERFDLYGKYADVLIPLRIKHEEFFPQKEFGLRGYKVEYYNMIKKFFHLKYSKRFNVIEHFCPLADGWNRKIRWQFPRDKMDYNFQPRKKICNLTKEVIREDDIIVDNEAVGYIKMDDCREINATDLFRDVNIGILIEALKMCEYVIGNMSFEISHLAVLLEKPLISIREKLSTDSIHLLNPLRTPIISCQNIREGVEIYENNFRPEKSGIGDRRRVIHFNKIGQ